MAPYTKEGVESLRNLPYIIGSRVKCAGGQTVNGGYTRSQLDGQDSFAMQSSGQAAKMTVKILLDPVAAVTTASMGVSLLEITYMYYLW